MFNLGTLEVSKLLLPLAKAMLGVDVQQPTSPVDPAESSSVQTVQSQEATSAFESGGTAHWHIVVNGNPSHAHKNDQSEPDGQSNEMRSHSSIRHSPRRSRFPPKQ